MAMDILALCLPERETEKIAQGCTDMGRSDEFGSLRFSLNFLPWTALQFHKQLLSLPRLRSVLCTTCFHQN